MSIVSYPYNLLQGLSDFWTRFFADSNQLDSLYQGTAVLLGQAYLDYMSATLGVSLSDALALDREHYKLFPVREDEVTFVKGASVDKDRWATFLPEGVVTIQSFDNKVIDPSASLEPSIDFEISNGVVFFKKDPTDPNNTGIPLDGYARRSVDVSFGGKFSDTAVSDWLASGVKKGDTLRLLSVSPSGVQRDQGSYLISLVRSSGLFVTMDAELPTPASGIKYVILRTPPDASVVAETFTLTQPPGELYQKALAHTRINQGSVRVYAKSSVGADVVEGVDYGINYESGTIYALNTSWQNFLSSHSIDYTWMAEAKPLSSSGVILASSTASRVTQIAGWAVDALVDRFTLANNFGVLIGRQKSSSESYRSFLKGIFQLYILGPALERMESALNVVLNFPVVRDDGETYQSTDTTDPAFDKIYTYRPSNNIVATYSFPKGTPLRTDLVVGQVLKSFEPLTTAVAVTDYVQTPDWWYGETIPTELFALPPDEALPSSRRIASPYYILNQINPVDGASIGDPGLLIGADENGFIPPGPTQPVFRHRMAFVLMDRYLKLHTFSVKFDVVNLSNIVGTAFGQSLVDLNDLVLSARPSHTYAFTTPTAKFVDVVNLEDSFTTTYEMGSSVYGPDKVIFSDDSPVIGDAPWQIGDYFKYQLTTSSLAFPAAGVPVAAGSAPTPPRRGYLVRVYIDGDVGGKALVENVDYSVDYAAETITRLTAWTSTTVNVTFRQLDIGNLADAPIGVGDMPLLINGVNPAIVTANFSPSASGWDGTANPPTAARDLGMVERALIVYPH